MVDGDAGTFRIQVRYYAAARDLAGRASEDLCLQGPAPTTGTLLRHLGRRHPALAAHLPRMRLAVNGDIVGSRTPLDAGDQVDVLPPVAGGSDGVMLSAIREAPLSVDECMAAVAHPSAGAVATFTGVVRDHADGRAVARLDYEAHPTLAEREMRQVLHDVSVEVPGVRLAGVHRVGQLGVGDLAVVVAASAPHRAEAFHACREAMERIKATVPIWKKEWAPDGTAHWVNLEG